MDEKVADDRLDNRRQSRNAKPQIVPDRDQYAIRRIRECPHHVHPFGPSLQMNKTNFEPLAINYFLGRPRDRDPGTPRGHHNDVAISPTLNKTDVTIMRQDLRPQLQVRCCLEDFHLRCANDNGIGLMHEQIETAQRLNVARLLPNTQSSSKIILMKEENRRMPRRLADPQ